ncbi:hypothetical protein BCR35DRAFT_91985 [Leucosporidium creatinivorum]|uniref:Sec39 domain-containing protein n=1 Tax=Leucosporidium creatinivorum TaxID=106004 RepID=A0A1Y2F9V7_9BASI|nr:hypothetical protein BCR35DRAFT_91985 [Leucosporidium creatinivorum]
MEQLDSLIATSSWSSALQHVHQHSLDPSYIPYLAQQQFLSTPSNQLDLATFNSLLNQINDPEWIASACYKLARESDHLPLVKAAIREGRKATDKVVEGYEELQLAVEEKDVEGVRELCSLDEGVRKVCLIEKGLIELGDRARTWEEIWGGAEEEKEKVAEKEGAEGKVKDDTKTDDDDEAAAWGSLDIPSSPSPRPSTPPTTSTPPCSLSTFLTEPLDDPSLSLAATSSLAPLLTLITRHSTLLWPLRTQLLHAIPEWEEPSSYLPLLTGVSPTDGREIKWVGQPWRAEPEFLEKVFEAPQPGEEDLEDRRTAEELTRVYRERIESVAEMGLVSVALGLVQHCASVEVPGLEELGEELSLLSRLVYDRPPPSSEQEEEDEGPYTLTHWRSRSPSQILALYLSTSTPSTIAPTIRRLVLPYLSVLESRLERSGTPDPSLPARLLNEWILALASSSTKGTPIDRLKLIESIFQNSKPTLPLPQRLVRNDEDLARLALSILYGSTESTSEALVLMGKIFECLPAFPDSSAGVKVPPALFDIFSLYPPTTPPPPPSTLFAHLAPLPLRPSPTSSTRSTCT